ncbi:GntR family transcriptional regulator [Burkholderia multivorans]|uniref:FadR/GntR family transcriptional regulator n=1 Tax=Burkholderia multivorans TaxID=87883 RepID=UPI0007558A21|nr:FCD domain-containing protein [Burkholderia multivorans]KWA30748.1 GntR family transcriptional regulator [Burkholderia multivorans]
MSDATFRAAGGRRLYAFLIEQISSESLGDGAKLPSERELGDRFCLSRGTVRRVLKTLVADGLVTQSAGSGTFVVRGAARSVKLHDAASMPILEESPSQTMDVSPAELMEARLLIEPLMPKLIARKATPTDFARMNECLVQAEAARSLPEFEHWDSELHRALAVSTHNTFFIRILSLVTQIRDKGEWGRLKYRSLTRERRGQYERQHRELVDALRNRDVERATSLLHNHLREVAIDLFDD